MISGLFTAFLALTASANALAVPDKRESDAHPSGVFYQPLTRIASNGTSVGLSRHFKRDDLAGDKPDVRGNGTDTYGLQFGFIGYKVNIELYDGNGNSLGTSFATIDTGSSDLWASTPTDGGLSTFFGWFDPASDKTGSTKQLYDGRNITIHYADTTEAVLQYWTGTIGTVNTTNPLKNFEFGSAVYTNASGGYLGIGFATNEVTASHKDYVDTYANYPVALKEQGFINKVAFSIFFGNGILPTEEGQPDAHILWGGIDHGLYTGELVIFPNQRSDYPAIHLDTITTSDGVVYPINNSSIIDTGSTTGILPKVIVDQINDALGYDGYLATKFPPDARLTLDFGTLKLDIPYSNFYYNIDNNSDYFPFSYSEDYNGLIILGDIVLSSIYAVFDYEANTTSIAKANSNVTYSDITVFQ